jgi:hypothetical protein
LFEPNAAFISWTMQMMRGTSLSDAHAEELRLAMDAAAAWRAKFHKSKASACNDITSQTPSTTASNILCASTCASSGNSDLDTSEGTTPEVTLSLSVPSERSAATTWAFVILLSEVSLYLADGLRAPLRLKTAGHQHRVRLYTGPWGRTGLCKHAGSALVLVDAAAALAAGARVIRGKGSLVLSPGSSIPSSAFRKMIHITNGTTLYERSVESSCDDQLEMDSESEAVASDDEPCEKCFASCPRLDASPAVRKVRSLRPAHKPRASAPRQEGPTSSLAVWLREL